MEEGEERAVLFAAYEAFKDHWGAVDEPFESYYQRRKHYMDNDPKYDPSLWLVAMDGDEIAGISLNYAYLDEDPDMGWVGTLGVRRPWRKHGIGLALLQYAFRDFTERGRKRVGLGVDASSLTGAVRLYERAGMHIWRKSNLYELEVRPGKDLMKQSL
jgi:ribosomal protein S18 acetylase RimI-like enzyme